MTPLHSCSTSSGAVQASYHSAKAEHWRPCQATDRPGPAKTLTASFTTRLGAEQTTRALPRKLHRAEQARAFRHRAPLCIESTISKRGCCLAADTCDEKNSKQSYVRTLFRARALSQNALL